MPEPDPTVASVQLEDDIWTLLLWGSDGSLIRSTPIGWDGSGDFYATELDHVVGALPAGYGYQQWQQVGDSSSYSAAIYRISYGPR